MVRGRVSWFFQKVQKVTDYLMPPAFYPPSFPTSGGGRTGDIVSRWWPDRWKQDKGILDLTPFVVSLHFVLYII